MSKMRPATSEDLPALASKLESLPLFAPYQVTAATLEETWRGALCRGEGLWVAEVDGSACGICWFIQGGAFGRGDYLRTLALAPGHQGRGLGRELLTVFESAGKPGGGWFLLVAAFNDGARRFYERAGYRLVGELPGFASPAVTEQVLWKAPRREARS